MEITKIKRNEYRAALSVVHSSFDRFDAKDFTPGGRDSFLNYASLRCFAVRQKRRHVTFLMKNGEIPEIAGLIELRADSHITMLFVSPAHIGRGFGRALVEHALEYMKKHKYEMSRVTVNASPFAYGFYRHLGFCDSGPAVNSDGLIYTPMQLLTGGGVHFSQ